MRFRSLALAVALLAVVPALHASAPPPAAVASRDSVSPAQIAVTDSLTIMPTPIVLFASYDTAVAVHGDVLPIGTMYPDPELLERRPHGRSVLTPAFRSERSQLRAPMVVVLPDGYHFPIDSVYWHDGVPAADGWTVTGEPPNVTLTPSVNIGGSWHGHIANGVISDDVEGKRFDYPSRR